MLKYFYNLFDKMKEKLTKKGQGMVEYALILGAVAVLAAVILADGGGLRTAITNAFDNANTQVTNATSSVGGSNSSTGGGNTTSDTSGGTEGGGI